MSCPSRSAERLRSTQVSRIVRYSQRTCDVPVAAGVNVTDTVQLLAATSIDGQLLVCANPPLTAYAVHTIERTAAEIRDGDRLRRTGGAHVLRNAQAGGVKLTAEGRGLGNERGTAP